ncbi:MAG: DUF3488 domain-containing transglutaminase family protein [Gammaproteobacteria bacterium]|nr:DUF3488 domain-containing transglutaminase family protein [Gammaproteobacteria bacterium]
MNIKISNLKLKFLGVMALLVYALLPLLSSLSWEQSLIVVLALILGPLLQSSIFSLNTQTSRLLQLVITMGLLLTAALSFYIRGAPWFTGDNFVGAFVIILALKWLESHQVRDLYLVLYGALILSAVSSRYLSGLAVVTYLIFGVLLFLTALHGLESRKRLSPRSSLFALKLFTLALPLTAMLFVTFPRIQGPLWDLGIVIGLPISLMVDQNDREKGIKGTLRAGQVSRLKQSDAPVLVAEFQNATPYKSRLYWRGPVFDHYDGTQWSLDDGWDNRSKLLKRAFKGKDSLEKTLTAKSELVSYQARVSPNNSRFLYALDMPVGRSTESFISEDFQMLGIRKLFTEFNYGQKAWLEYSGGRPLNKAQRNKYTALPQDSNPRLVAWGQQLLSQYPTAEQRIQALRIHLATGGYILTLTPEIKEYTNSLDEFFFDRKEGGIEHLASTTAIVLRAAGVPTRLVSGYRGGSLIALTNFIVVRQANAHVWVEAWDDKSGWSRIEAKDFVSPPVDKKPATKTKTVAQPKPSTVAAAESAATPKKAAIKASVKKNPPQRDRGIGWLNSLGSGIETWIFNYNPDRQIELMHKTGFTNIDWKSLLALATLGLLLLFVLYGLVINIKREPQDPVVKAFERLNQALKKRELHCLAHECPNHWLVRLQTTDPQLYPALEVVINQYIDIRYRGTLNANQIKELNRDIKRLSAML